MKFFVTNNLNEATTLRDLINTALNHTCVGNYTNVYNNGNDEYLVIIDQYAFENVVGVDSYSFSETYPENFGENTTIQM